eukprot:scaffold1501_cov331-Prasinococcus_capsulatus_cf.AAC.5
MGQAHSNRKTLTHPAPRSSHDTNEGQESEDTPWTPRSQSSSEMAFDPARSDDSGTGTFKYAERACAILEAWEAGYSTKEEHVQQSEQEHLARTRVSATAPAKGFGRARAAATLQPVVKGPQST